MFIDGRRRIFESESVDPDFDDHTDFLMSGRVQDIMHTCYEHGNNLFESRPYVRKLRREQTAARAHVAGCLRYMRRERDRIAAMHRNWQRQEAERARAKHVHDREHAADAARRKQIKLERAAARRQEQENWERTYHRIREQQDKMTRERALARTYPAVFEHELYGRLDPRKPVMEALEQARRAYVEGRLADRETAPETWPRPQPSKGVP